MPRNLYTTLFIALWGLVGLAEWVWKGLPIYHESSVSIGQNLATLGLFLMFGYGTYASVAMLRERRRTALAKNLEEEARQPQTQFNSLTSLAPPPVGGRPGGGRKLE